MRSSFCAPVASMARSLLHQQQWVGAERDSLPGGGIALGEAPCAAAAREQELLAVEPPGGEPEACDCGIAAGLDDDLVSIFCAGGSVRERQLAERLVELAQDAPLAENLIGAANFGLERGLSLYEVEALAFALALVHAAFDLGELEHRDFAGIDEAKHIVRSERPGHHVLERWNRGPADRIEFQLEAIRHGIDAEGHRAALVAVGIGDLPSADELLG